MSGEMGRIRVVLDGFEGGPGVASFYYRGPGALNWDFIAPEITTAVLACFTASAALFPSTMTFAVQANVDLINPVNGALLETKTGTAASSAGTSGDQYGPIATGICVNWLTGIIVRRRHLRGRTFLVPVWGGNIQADGTPSSTAMGLADDFADAITAVETAGARQVIWSRPTFTEPGHTNNEDGTDSSVIGHAIADKFAVLRSRRD